MVANVRGYTPNYKFKLINFDTPRWHTLEYDNLQQIDALLFQGGIPQIRGTWFNSILYFAGDRVLEGETGALYRCTEEHTSAPTGTFQQDRDNPAGAQGKWIYVQPGVPLYRDEWQEGAVYSPGDIVHINQYTYYLCGRQHMSTAETSPAATPNEFWEFIFDATAAIDAAQDAADAAETSANNAATSEGNASGFADNAQGFANNAEQSKIDAEAARDTALEYKDGAETARDAAEVHAQNAETSATAASLSATNAENSAIAAASQAEALKGTSTSLNEISNGLKLFETQADKHFYPGTFLTVVNGDDITTGLACTVDAYTGTTLQCTATGFTGTGVSSNWLIYVSGSEGLDGTPGTPGIDGTDGDPGLVWRGNWNSAVMYLAKDAVAHLGSSYIALLPNTNSEPPSVNWSMLAQGGSVAIADDQVVPSNLDADTGAKQLLFRDRLNFVSRSGDQITGALAIGSVPTQATEKFKVADPGGASIIFDIDAASKALKINSEAYTGTAIYGNRYYDSMARGTKVAPVKLEVGDMITGRSVNGYDGIKFAPESAAVCYAVDGDVSTDNVPTSIQFRTGSGGLTSTYPTTPRLTIKSDGKVLLLNQTAGYTDATQLVPKSYVDAAAAASPNAVMKNVTTLQQMIGSLGITNALAEGAFLQLNNTVDPSNWKVVNTGGDHGTAGDLYFWNSVGGTRAYFQKNGGFINVGHIHGLQQVFAGYSTPKSGTYYFGNSTVFNLSAPGNDELNINGFTNVRAPQAGIICSVFYTVNSASPTTGAIYFGNTNTKYLYYNGTDFHFAGGSLVANKVITTGPNGIQNTVAASNDALFVSAVTGARTFHVGTNSNGVFVINDATAAQTRFHIDSAGNAGFYKSLTVSSGLTVIDDITTRRNSAPNTGLVHFGNTGVKYLYFDGGTFNFVGGPVSGGEPTVGTHLATKTYVDSKVSSGSFLPLAGGTLAGKLYMANTAAPYAHISHGGSGGAIEVMSYNSDVSAMISFHRPGAFGANFGLDYDNELCWGGWSFGAVRYRLWSEKHGGWPVSNFRMVYIGDYGHAYYNGMEEPYAGCAHTGASGGYTGQFRYRQCQILTNTWYAVGYA